MCQQENHPVQTDEENAQLNTIARATREILIAIGEDPDRDGLKDTPQRFARALRDLTRGMSGSLQETVGTALFESDNDEMVVVRNIEFYSLCEHHMLPIIGYVDIGYIPNGKVLGLSKLARIVELYARRLQIQENMTQQIAEAVEQATNALGVGVQIRAEHMCMAMRGVEKVESETITSRMTGLFRENPATRSEFLQLISQTGIGR